MLALVLALATLLMQVEQDTSRGQHLAHATTGQPSRTHTHQQQQQHSPRHAMGLVSWRSPAAGRQP